MSSTSTDIMDKKGEYNNMTTDEIFDFMNLYFNRKNIIYRHLYDSFNKFIDEDIRAFLESGEHSFFDKMKDNKFIKYRFEYDNIRIKEPTMDNEMEPMFPSDARNRNLTYFIKVIARVTQYQDVIDVVTNEKVINQIGEPEENIPIANIPVMVNSRYCSLNMHKGYDKTECRYDPGGYFIVNGSEKVIISQDRIIENKPLVFIRKESGVEYNVVTINSRSYKPHGMSQIINIRLKKDGDLLIKVPIISEVSIISLFRALGVQTDRDIINYCVYDERDFDMVNIMRSAIENCVDDNNDKILTQDQAIEFLLPKIRVTRKYSEHDKNIKNIQRRMHLQSLLNNSFLPHIEGTQVEKAIYLGYMINKLLRVELGRLEADDRDSYLNKRIDLPGDLMMELFKQNYRKMLNECGRNFKKRNPSDEQAINIINQIRAGTIEQGMKVSLATGSWIHRKGVAQMLTRLSYLYTISFMTRLDTPGGDVSSSKLTGPRHLHPSTSGFLCLFSTPEHAKVGLTKHFGLVTSVSIMTYSQYAIIKQFLKRRVKNIQDVSADQIRTYYKLFLNGEWLGITNDHMKLEEDLRKSKLNGTFEPTISIVLDVDARELRVYCDTGRMYRPVIRVEDNIVKLTRKHLQLVSLNRSDKDKISSWDEFMLKNPGVIEYIDTEEQPYLLLAVKQSDVEEVRQRELASIKKASEVKSNLIENRYDDMVFEKKTHCEFHPSFLLSVIGTNIPFCNHNQGTRATFQYAQGRQAMGIYITNYRERLDISYILYHPHKRLVQTRTSKYVYTDILTSGENAVLAIACYTGYNQEDSLVMNRSAIERGLFRSSSLKKHISQIQKNQSTSQDDQFMKPDPTKVTGMRFASYDKLNDKGYVPEETKIVNNDVIIGKVSPIQPVGNSNKIFRDNSEIFKTLVPAVIDKVYTNIYNNEGYEMRKIRTRSEREPQVGDKFASSFGQKGTIGIKLKRSDMPFTKDGIVPDVIMNPNCLPSRLTINQLIEVVLGKIGALKGVEMDGTPFENTDLDKTMKELEKLGYKDSGTEYLYNGMTGSKIKTQIFIGPSYFMRLKHLVEDKLHCLSPDHQVLTAYNGWKFINEITTDDEIACLKDGKLVYDFPTDIHKYHNYAGKMYQIKTKQIDLLTTLNHRMWTSRIGGEFDFEYAENIIGKTRKYKKNAEVSEIKLSYKPASCNPVSDTWLNFIAIWIKNYQTIELNNCGEFYEVIFNMCTPDIIKELKEIIEELKYIYSINNQKFTISNKELYNLISTSSIEAYGIPLNVLWNLNQKQSHDFLHRIIVDKALYSTSEKLCDDIMVLALHAGLSATKRLYFRALQESEKNIWKVEINYDNEPEVNSAHTGEQYEKIIDNYTGGVYCITVPSGVFYVRRNGKAVWTGNSRARGPRTLLTRSAPEGRSRDGGLRVGEMERDAIAAHGMSRFLIEKMMFSSDPYRVHVCDVCGLFAQRLYKKDAKSYATTKDIYYCATCKNYNQISEIMIPYAFKLLTQELLAMNIAPRIRVKKSLFSS